MEYREKGIAKYPEYLGRLAKTALLDQLDHFNTLWDNKRQVSSKFTHYNLVKRSSSFIYEDFLIWLTAGSVTA